MTDEERRRLEALWRPTLVEVDGRTYVCGAANPAPPYPGGFVWLTSDEPHGRPTDAQQTAARRIALRGELDARAWTWSAAPSAAPDGSHGELGVALHGAAVDEALDLARAFDQLAVFVVDADGTMDVVWCA